jgi:hypothetical protein
MSVQHELLLSVVDKLLIGGLLAAVGFWLDRRFDLLRTGQGMVSAMLDRRPSLKQAFSATQRDRALDLVHKQLSLLYWPLYMRLQQQEAARKHRARPGVVPGQTDTVALIEKQAYLIGDEHLLAELLRYVKHVAVHRASAAGDASQGHAAPGEPYPEDLLDLVERKLAALQAEEQRLLHTKALGALL